MANIHELNIFNQPNQSSPTEVLLENFIKILDYGLVNSGEYVNINIPSSSIPNDKSRLKLYNKSGYINGCVWKTPQGNYVWESDLQYGTPYPLGTIKVNGTNVTSGFKINTEEGYVVFNTPLAESSVVQMAHSVKKYSVKSFHDFPYVKLLTAEKVSIDGSKANIGPHIVDLPSITVEVLPAHEQVGYQLGGGKEYSHNVFIYILSKTSKDGYKILDSLNTIQHQTITLFDTSTLAKTGVKLFDVNGFISPSSVSDYKYSNLITNHTYKNCYIELCDTPKISKIDTDLYLSSLRLTCVLRG